MQTTIATHAQTAAYAEHCEDWEQVWQRWQAAHRRCAEFVAHVLHRLPELLHVQAAIAIGVELPEQLRQMLLERVACRRLAAGGRCSSQLRCGPCGDVVF